MIDTAINAHEGADKRSDRAEANRRAVRSWLGFVLLAILALVLVGGATRLTDSGLSITEWKPIHGAIPPLSVAEWEEEFALYKQIPEYSQINKGMTLDEFKVIFWWEWAHRLIARWIGVIFGVPLLFFWATGRLEKSLRWPLTGILALGGLQGAIGWWMVSSGLAKRVDVSQYRLAVHLTVACLIFASIAWVWRGLAPPSGQAMPRSPQAKAAGALLFLVLLQIYLGALVAGLDAGLAFNTWPLIDGAIIPDGLWVMKPLWLNLFENIKTVQFVHRMNAYLMFAAALANMIWLLRSLPATAHANRGVILFGMVFLQAGLGVATLLTHVDIGLALAHQGFAVIILGFAVANLRGYLGEYPRGPHTSNLFDLLSSIARRSFRASP
ncbi:COX15/CtaA family protein [Rhizobium sp. FKL33]|uniref:COX15/CtaA family protein n=1 Tax=Rhizobium sp. FKL33 TaxID=2562307 RepID=UPI0010C13581|nr:COX15/CtaA family protein [Rhizobium sp. FKL33]